MTNIVAGLVGIALVFAFLGVMLIWVPALPLIIIVVLVMSLLLIDFWQSTRNGKRWR